MRSILIAALAVALPASAETPGGRFYFGGGLAWSVPLNGSVVEQRQSTALSIDLTREWESALVGLRLVNSPDTRINPDLFAGAPWDAIALHGALILRPQGWFSPYVGGGLGLMFVGFRMTDTDCGCTFYHWTSGPAGLLEAGLLFFREASWGRVSLAADLWLPFFTVRPESIPPSAGSQNIFILTLGLRVQL